MEFWKGKKVLITGHTGFKGAWMALWLHRLGANVVGASLPPSAHPNLYTLAKVNEIVKNYFIDIRDEIKISELINREQPEVIFHLAAQSLVRRGYLEPLTTFNTNVQGTANVLEAARGVRSIMAIVVVTTDKVYKNFNRVTPYTEEDILGGHDPYSASKAASEMVVSCYRNSYLNYEGIAIASARAGNVIGGGDWSEDRLIPDAIRAWSGKEILKVRNPNAVRPWQHVLEPLFGYMTLAEKLCGDSSYSGAYNFGPEPEGAASVSLVISKARDSYGNCEVQFMQDDSAGLYEARYLALQNLKAKEFLGVKPRWDLHDAILQTIGWYKLHSNGECARELCFQNIDHYEGVN